MWKEKALIWGTFILRLPGQSGAGAWGREGAGFDLWDYYSGRGEVLEEKGRKGAGKKRLGENLGPLVPLPQTKIKTRILKGDLIPQSQGWGKGWAGGHCLPLLKSPFLYIHRGSGDSGVLGSSSQNLKFGPLCKTLPPLPPP